MAIRKEMINKYPKNWYELSQNLIKKRGNICEICKIRGIKRDTHLTVHHKDRNPENNEEINLIVCCPKHHFNMEYLINKGYYNEKQLNLSLL